MQRFAAMLTIALLFAFTGFNAHAETRTINAKCSLKIDGITHMNSPCHFSSDARGDSFDDLRLLIVCPNGRSAETTNCYGNILAASLVFQVRQFARVEVARHLAPTPRDIRRTPRR